MNEEFAPPQVLIKNLMTGETSNNPVAVGKAMQSLDQHHDNALVFRWRNEIFHEDILAYLNDRALYQLMWV